MRAPMRKRRPRPIRRSCRHAASTPRPPAPMRSRWRCRSRGAGIHVRSSFSRWGVRRTLTSERTSGRFVRRCGPGTGPAPAMASRQCRSRCGTRIAGATGRRGQLSGSATAKRRPRATQQCCPPTTGMRHCRPSAPASAMRRRRYRWRGTKPCSPASRPIPAWCGHASCCSRPCRTRRTRSGAPRSSSSTATPRSRRSGWPRAGAGICPRSQPPPSSDCLMTTNCSIRGPMTTRYAAPQPAPAKPAPAQAALSRATPAYAAPSQPTPVAPLLPKPGVGPE